MSLFLGSAIFLLFITITICIFHFYSLSLYKNPKQNLHSLIVETEQQGYMLDSLASSFEENPANRDLLLILENCVKYLQAIAGILDNLVQGNQHENSQETNHLKYCWFLLHDSKRRISFLSSGTTRQKKVSAYKIRHHKSSLHQKGCYFCSCPVTNHFRSNVKIKVGGKKIKVKSCRVCRDTLHKNGTVKILFFLVNNKKIHWKEFDEYVPNTHFWNINIR